jgi:hypothetical protein
MNEGRAVIGPNPPRIFERFDTAWVQTGVLIPDVGIIDFGATYGQIFAIEGDRIVAGAPADRAAFIFERLGSGEWIQVARLTPSQGGWLFGYSVALDGDIVVVGAPNDGSQGNYAGAAFVFERQPDGSWTQTGRLLSSEGNVFDSQGESVAIVGENVFVGAPLAGPDPEENGRVYVFSRAENGGWQQAQILAGDYSPEWAFFGGWMAVDGERLLVGARWDLGPPGVYSGSVYVFQLEEGQWQRVSKLFPPNATDYYRFGERVALSANNALIAAGLWDLEFGAQSGDVYLYAVGPDADANGTMDVCECLAAGDLDLSGATGLQDLLLLLSAFGRDDAGDLDDDNDTDLSDLTVLLANYGNPCP